MIEIILNGPGLPTASMFMPGCPPAETIISGRLLYERAAMRQSEVELFKSILDNSYVISYISLILKNGVPVYSLGLVEKAK